MFCSVQIKNKSETRLILWKWLEPVEVSRVLAFKNYAFNERLYQEYQVGSFPQWFKACCVLRVYPQECVTCGRHDKNK